MSKIDEIFGRVEASMCMTHGNAFPEGRMEARITQDDWEALKKIVSFYAKHEHWMSIGEDGPCVVLVAHGDVSGADGWAMAESDKPPLN